MTLLNAQGEQIPFQISLPEGTTDYNVEGYSWVPKDMVIMISSRNVTLLHAGKKFQISHDEFVQLRKDLKEKLNAALRDAEAKKTSQAIDENAQPKAEEGIEASAP